MSNVIDSFLVALGFQVDEKSAKEATSSIDGIKSGALKMGATLATAFAAAGYAAQKSAREMTDLKRSADLLSNINVTALDKYRYVFERAGGSPEEADATFRQLESMLGDLNMLGEIGAFEGLAKLGLPSDFLMDAKTSVDLFERLAEIYPSLSPERQGMASQQLGLGRGADLLLRGGRDNIDSWYEDAGRYAQVTEQMAAGSEQLIHAEQNFGRAVDGLTRNFSSLVSGDAAKAIQSWAEFMGDAGNGILPDSGVGGFINNRVKGFEAPESAKGIPKWIFRNFGMGQFYQDLKYLAPVSIPSFDSSNYSDVDLMRPAPAGSGKIIRNEINNTITVNEAANANVTADAVSKKVVESIQQATEEMKTGNAG